MGTSNHHMDERMMRIINRSIEEQQRTCQQAASELDVWHCPSLDSENFWRLLSSAAQAIMAKRGVYHPFIVDENNQDIIRQMWLYVIGSKNCKWNIHKGIYLGGKVGCGKTVLMQAFCEVLHVVSGRFITMIPANQLYQQIQSVGIKSLLNAPLFIDELGREQVEVNDFGNRIKPINELIQLRYETGARTFFTSNFKLSTLSREYNDKGERQGYGEYIGERIQEMTNMVILPGDSRREKWEVEK